MDTAFLVDSTCNSFFYINSPPKKQFLNYLYMEFKKQYCQVLTVWVKILTVCTVFVLLLSYSWLILIRFINLVYLRNLFHECNKICNEETVFFTVTFI